MTDHTNPSPKYHTSELREKLAAIEHERWADWQRWCHKVLWDNIPSDVMQDYVYPILKRWDVQIETPYEDLTVMEKDTDREQVDRYWPLIEQYIHEEVVRARIEELKNIFEWGYPGSSYTGVATKLAKAPNNTVEDRINQLEKELKGEV